ncbi:HAD family hydrolase [Pseudonocardia xishanensis]|uniref:2-haloacid dehalogenase n=1 Tax=Pseudonocardia xishanensis TaxID=630995 RepID=A0ABP8RG11_9PSEU
MAIGLGGATRRSWGSSRTSAPARGRARTRPEPPDPADPTDPAERPRRPRAVLVDVYGTLLHVEALRRRFLDVGRPEHEYDLVLARALRDSTGLALAGTPASFAEVLGEAVRAVAGPTVSDDAVDHVVSGMHDLPRHPDAEPALAVLARSRIPAWAMAQGSGAHTTGALDGNGLRSFLRGTVATDDLTAVPPQREAYRLACAAARIEPSTTAFVSSQPYLVHGAMRAGLVGALVLRGDARRPATLPAPHACGTTLVTAVEALLALPA